MAYTPIAMYFAAAYLVGASCWMLLAGPVPGRRASRARAWSFWISTLIWPICVIWVVAWATLDWARSPRGPK